MSWYRHVHVAGLTAMGSVGIFLTAVFLINRSSASYQVLDTGSTVSNLWESFELKLRDVVQEAITKEDGNHRKIRNVDTVTWTGFVPSLHHRRDQLEIDSIEVLPAKLICLSQDISDKPILDSISHKRIFYTVVACGKVLRLYGFNASAHYLLDTKALSNSATKITHVKFYDTKSGDLRLFVLVLTKFGVDIFTLEKEKLEFSYTQELAGQYAGIELFYEDGEVYCMLVSKSSADRVIPSVYQLAIVHDKVIFRLLASSAILNGAAQMRTCSLNGRAYILQPNHDLGKLNVYKMNGKTIEFFQVLEVPGIKDFDCFRIGSEDFIIIGTSASLNIYEDNSGFFDVVQKVPRVGVKNVKAFAMPTESNEAVVLVKGFYRKDFFEMWIYDSLALQFKPVPFECYLTVDWNDLSPKRFDSTNLGCFNDMAFTDLKSSTALNLDNTLVLHLSNDRHLWTVKIEAHLTPVESPVLRELVDTQKRLESAVSSASAIEERSRDLEEFSKGILLYGSDVKIVGSWNVKTLLVPSLELDTLENEQVHFNEEIWIPGLDTAVMGLEKKTEDLEKSIAEINNRLNGVILNGTEATVNFESLRVKGEMLIEDLKAVEVVLETLNGEKFNLMLSDLIRKDSTKLLSAVKVLGSLTTDALQADYVNNILVEDIALNDNGNVQLHGDLTIDDDFTVMGNVAVTGKINGLDLSRQLVTSKNPASSINFTGVVSATHLNVNGYMDRVNVSYLLSNLLRKDTNGPTFNDVELDELIIEGDLEVASGFVRGVNLTALNESVLRLNADEIMASYLAFNNVVLNKSLDVDHINGIQFDDFVLKSDTLEHFTMTGDKIFENDVSVRTLLTHRVNGHEIKDIVTLDTDQEITSPISFSKGFEVVNGDLTVEKINNVLWKSVREKGLHPAIFEQQNLEKDVTLVGSSTIKGVLISEIAIEDESLDSLLDDLVYQDESHVEITGKKSFPSLSTENLRVFGFINGKKILDDILTSDTDQFIAGHYELMNEVSFTNLEIKGKLNQFDVSELLSNVLRVDELDQPIECQLTFKNLTINKGITVDGAINGISTSDILLDGLDQTFTVSQTLISPEFSKLGIDGNLVLADPATLVNNFDLDLFDRKRATISTDQWINANWHLNEATVSSMSLRKLNGLTLDEWQSNFLHAKSSSAQVIKANDAVFETLEIMGNVTTLGKGISDYDWKEYSRNAGDIRTEITFKSDVSFQSLEAGRLYVSGTFNNVSLGELARDSVFRDLNQTITGVKKFSTIKVIGNVDTQLINGEHLLKTYLHKTADQQIEAPIHFSGNLSAEDVELTGSAATLNGVPKDLIFSSSQIRPFNVHLGDVVFEGPIDVKSLQVQSLLNENWDDLVSSIAYVDRTNNFTEPLIFNSVKFNDSLHATLVNNVNLRRFTDEVVFVNVPSTITGKKTFWSLEAHDLNTRQITAESVDPDVISTSTNAIYLSSTIPVAGTVHFKNVVHVKGNIEIEELNGSRFPSGYLLLKKDQSLPGTLNVNRLAMNGNISLVKGAQINGFDLETECANTWTIDEKKPIKSVKVFKGEVKFLDDLQVTKTVNSISKFDQEVIKLSDGGTIYGAPKWENVIVRGDVTGVRLTNDINIAALAEQALYIDTAIQTSAKWSTSKASVPNGHLLLPVEATVNGDSFRVGELLGEREIAALKSLKIEEQKLYEAALSWHDALRKAYFKMEYLAPSQTLTLPFQVTALQETNVNSTSLLLVGTRNGTAIFVRRTNESSYSHAHSLSSIGHVKSFFPISPGQFASICSHGTRHWQITDLNPLAVEEVISYEDRSYEITDVTDEAFPSFPFDMEYHTSGPNSSVDLSTTFFGIYEKSKTAEDTTELSNQTITSFRVHKFQLGSKSMIALVPTFSPEVVANVVGCPGVRIFSASHGNMKLEHIIQACDVRAVDSFTHGNLPDNYLLLAEHDGVSVYHYQGASGFVERFRLPYPSADAVRSWNFGTGYESETLVAVGKAYRVVVHKASTIGEYIRD